MKRILPYIVFLLVLILSGCDMGTLVMTHDRVVYQNFHGKLSCIGLRCCYPYGAKFMVCNQGMETGDGVFVRFYYDKK